MQPVMSVTATPSEALIALAQTWQDEAFADDQAFRGQMGQQLS